MVISAREFLDKRGLSHYPQGDMGETYGFNFRHFEAKYIDCKQDYTGQGTAIKCIKFNKK